MMNFKNLVPLAASLSSSGTSNPLKFILSVMPDGASITVEGNTNNLESASVQEAVLVKEITRSNSSNAFGVEWGVKNNLSVSLASFPHIALMLKGVDNVFDPSGNKLSFAESEARLFLQIEPADNGQVVPSLVAIDDDDNQLDAPAFVSDSLLLSGNIIYPIRSVGRNFTHIKEVIEPITVGLLESYLSIFLSFFDNIIPVYKGRKAIVSPTPALSLPTIILQKVASDQALYMRLTQSAEGSAGEGIDSDLPPVSKQVTVAEDGQIRVRAIAPVDLAPFAEELQDMLNHSAPTAKARRDIFCEDGFYIVPFETASPFLYTYLPRVLSMFRLLGVDKLKEYKVLPSKPKLKLKLSSGIDFLEGDAEIEVNGEQLTLAALLEQYARNKYVQLSDGNRVIIDESYIKRLQRLFDVKNKKGKVKVSIFDLPEIEELLDERLQGAAVKRTRQLFEGFNRLRASKLPKINLNATLRPYQAEGIKWIKYLYDNEMGGCLADDMGLGKTIQTIGVLAQIYPGADKPTLIVMPRSLLFNWQEELRRFAPQIEQATYYGSNRDLDMCMSAQVILTTYAMVRNDIEQLRKVEFQYVVLDESQNIKNVGSQTAQAVSILKSAHRLALSGTPMENNLTELYSLFRFLNPAMFGTLDDFNSNFTVPIQKNGDKEATTALRRKIFPFMLRRLKGDVLDDLPERIEQKLYVEMSAAQADLYEKRRREYKEEITRTVASQGVQKSQFVMFQALNELRQIASIPENVSNGRVSSPKIELLRDNVAQVVENGHKVVVFFNFLAGIELLGDELQKLGIDYETMSGSTSASRRKGIVHRFQTDSDCRVLLMTLKVGGVGLNLTAADTVFIAEPWWNKAAEEQAVNRLHRIGQKSVVNSYSIITSGTIEEKILKLQEMKQELFDGLIEADGSSSKMLTQEDIDFILS